MAGSTPMKSTAHVYNLFCPMCTERMESLIVDTTGSGEAQEETIWWTCRGLRNKTCDFPLNMPSEVFWTKRNAQQIKSDVVPLPNFHKLPPKYHKIYKSFFEPVRANPTPTTPIPKLGIKRKCGLLPKSLSRLNAAHRSEESSTPKQSKPPQVTTEHLVELINSQVPYLPDAETMCARLGRGYVASPKPAPTTSTTADWNALGLSAGQNGTSHNPPMDLPQDRSSSENLPSCSSGASSTSQPPPNEIVPEAPLGDEELDSMIQGNYSGLIRTGKLKKRRKKVKEQPPAETLHVPPANDFASELNFNNGFVTHFDDAHYDLLWE